MWMQTMWIDTACGDTQWPHGQHMVIHSDHMGNIWWYILGIMWDTHRPHGHYVGYTLTTLTIYTETCWQWRLHSLIHFDHAGIIWDTLWPRGQYILKHADHEDHIAWCTLTTWALCRIRSDNESIIWDILWLRGHYVGYTLTTWTIYIETYWHVDSIDWYNIWRDMMTAWALSGDTVWPSRHNGLTQHIATHTDHLAHTVLLWHCGHCMARHTNHADRIDWYDILWYILTIWAIYTDLWPHG